MKKLTVIIPFLNERDEIRSTLKSMHSFLEDDVDVILINDCSIEDYDYECIAAEYGATYVKNEQRKGVAACRDLGVKICRTPFFLLLDGHMRFYDGTWVKTIVAELERSDRVLLCCQTKFLKKSDYGIEENPSMCYGAYVEIMGSRNPFAAYWLNSDPEPEVDVMDIPCVLGAAYAGSKRYWHYLKGLEGLCSYGCDEAYISLKVWLEGGRCRLLKRTLIGHIYREKFPYIVDDVDTVYNKLLINELLFSGRIKADIFEEIKRSNAQIFLKAFERIIKDKSSIEFLHAYYCNIFTRDLSEIIKYNRIHLLNPRNLILHKKLVEKIRKMVLRNLDKVKSIGFYDGKMGLALFLCLYQRYMNDYADQELIEQLLDEIYAGITPELPVTFGQGICGIGWGIEYLIQNGFMEGDSDEILKESDKKVMERSPLRISDWRLYSGLGGVLVYVFCRLNVRRELGKLSPFDEEYLSELEEAAKQMIQNPEVKGISAAYRFLEYRRTGLLDYSLPDLKEIIGSFLLDKNRSNLKINMEGYLGMVIRLLDDYCTV